jgi:hypothetical protein
VTHHMGGGLERRGRLTGCCYFEFFDAMRAGSRLLVSPESARRYMSVLDRCRAQLAELA